MLRLLRIVFTAAPGGEGEAGRRPEAGASGSSTPQFREQLNFAVFIY